MNVLGQIILFMGIVLVIIGCMVAFSAKIPLIGKLPGDVFIQKKRFTFYFPLTTAILISILLSAIVHFIRR